MESRKSVVKLYIDNQQADTDHRLSLSIDISAQQMIELSAEQAIYPVTIPITTNNSRIMGNAECVNNAQQFNSRSHTARIEVDGSIILQGNLRLAEIKKSTSDIGEYILQIRQPINQWIAEAQDTALKDVDIQFQEPFTPAMIQQSWEWDKPVRFFPIERDRYSTIGEDPTIVPPARIATMEDYHPFINLKQLLETTFFNAGYRIKSEFMDTLLFRSLYISGNYKQRNTETAKNRTDFRAGCFEDKTATADQYGRIKADPLSNFNTIGNIVDTADPDEIQNGAKASGVFNTNNVLRKIDSRIAFAPSSETIAGFELNLHYTTNYKIKNRNELSGFNTINLGDGTSCSFKIPNKFEDRAKTIETMHSYMLIIFDPDPALTYEIRYDEVTQGNNLTKVLKTFNSRTTHVEIISAAAITNFRVVIHAPGFPVEVPCLYDWALYDGYIAESGTTQVSIVVRSEPTAASTAKPHYFDRMYFAGGEPGQILTLLKHSYIRPIYASYPAIDSQICFQDIAVNNMKMIDIIKGVQQMFNLCFITDNTTKEVVIEPSNNIIDPSVVVDWSGKEDMSKPISIEQPSMDSYRSIALEYKTEDASVERWNNENDQSLGRYCLSLNIHADQKEKLLANPIFSPSISEASVFDNVPAMTVIRAGDRDQYEITETLNFSIKIVLYAGIVDENQGSESYPLVAFHFKGENNNHIGPEPNPLSTFAHHQQTLIDNGFSLCFEDRDSVAGIHRFYDKDIAKAENGKKITVYLNLKPSDVESIVTMNPSKKDIRAVYRLTIDHEEVLCRLEQIENYDPSKSKTTKCVFTKL